MSQMVLMLILKLKYYLKRGGMEWQTLPPTAKMNIRKSVDIVDV